MLTRPRLFLARRLCPSGGWHIAPRRMTVIHALAHRFRWNHGYVTSWTTGWGYCIAFECATCGGIRSDTVVMHKEPTDE